MTFPLISVVIPTRNRSQLLKRAVSSVQAQTYAAVEIIVVDDGSDEDITHALSEFRDSRFPVRILRNDVNEGAQQSRLRGVRAACGEMVALLDSDDWWEPDKLNMQYNASMDAPGCLISCRTRLMTSGKIIPSLVIKDHEKVEDYLYVHGGFLQSSTFLCARELLIDGLCNTLGGCHNDTHLAIYLKNKGIKIIQINDVLSHFDDFPRKDRLSLNKDVIEKSLHWYDCFTGDWSAQAKAGYMARDTARRYLNNGMRFRAFLTLLSAYYPKLPAMLYIRTLISILFGGSPLRFFRGQQKTRDSGRG